MFAATMIMCRSVGACSRLRSFLLVFPGPCAVFRGSAHFLFPLPSVIPPVSPYVSGCRFHFSFRVTLGCNHVLATLVVRM